MSLAADGAGSRKRPVAEQHMATSGDGLEAKVAALEEELGFAKATTQKLRGIMNLLMAGFIELAQPDNLQKGVWIRKLYQAAFSCAFGGTSAITSEALTAVIDALDGQPMETEEDRRKALLRALYEGRGIAEVKVAITALLVGTAYGESIVPLCDSSTDSAALVSMLKSEASKAKLPQLNVAISSLVEAARTRGGVVAQHTAGVLALDGMRGQICRIDALLAGGGHAPAEASREDASAAADALMSMASLAPPQGRAPAPVAATGPGDVAATGPGELGPVAPGDDIVLADVEENVGDPCLLLGGRVADGDERGDHTSGEPPEPKVLTADYFRRLISHLQAGGKDREMTLTSGFFIQVRRRVRDWSVKVVPRYEDLNSKKQRQISSEDPRCLTNEDAIRTYLADRARAAAAI